MKNSEQELFNHMFISKYNLSLIEENEKSFRKKYFEDSLGQFRISFVIVTLLYSVFGYLDTSLVTEFQSLFHLIRYAVVVPLLLFVFLLSFFNKFKLLWQELIFICFITSGAGITIMIIKAPENYLYYTGMMLIFAAGYFFVTLRFFYATLAGWITIIIFNMCAIYFSEMNTSIIIGSNFFFCAANLIGMFAAYNIEFYKRKDFLLNQQLDKQNIEISEANKNLELKVNLRTKELIAAKEKAEESDRLKSAFLANMSHEIRTPMNGILGFTQLLNDPHFSGKQKQDFLKIIQKSGQRMLNTVNDLIDISKIETGQIHLQFTYDNIIDKIENLVRFFTTEANEKKINLNINCKILPERAKIKTDTNKFDSILSNLIKNAIKFTDSGTVEVGCSNFDNVYQFYVRDTGIGIPKNRQEAIFNRFEQADISDARVFEGSGLGLVIVKAYVEMLDGKIWLESEEHKGSTFYFKITADVLSDINLEKNEQDKSFFENKANKKVKVIIAEDDDTSFLYLYALLNPHEFEIIRTKTGYETIEQLRNYPDTDLILMDIKMPELDGYSTTQQIRKFNKEVKIIAQTAFSLLGDRSKAIDSGCNDYISKPINKDELISLIYKILTP